MLCIQRRCSLLNLFTANGVGVELFVRLVAGKPVHVEHHGKMHLKSNPKRDVLSLQDTEHVQTSGHL